MSIVMNHSVLRLLSVVSVSGLEYGLINLILSDHIQLISIVLAGHDLAIHDHRL